MKEDIRFIDIQLPHYSKILEALIASCGKSENIDGVEIYLYLGKEKKPLKIILRPESKFTHLNAVYLSAIFNVTTPLHYGAEAGVHIGKAQIIPKPKTKNPINSTSHYSLNIELTEESTNFTKYFIERIKVLKDELGVAKETLRLTGDIFHILPNAKKRFNIVKNKINFEHFDSPKIDSLNQKENNPSLLHLDISVSKNILLPEILKDLKKWKKILSLETIDISLDNGLKIGHVSKFVYRANSPRGNDCTYELVAKCEINNSDASNGIGYANLLGPTIRFAARKSLENAYLNYKKKKRKKEDKQTS